MRAAVLAGIAYFASVFALGFALGFVRVFLIAPTLGEVGAVALELPLILLASWFFCGWIIRNRSIGHDVAARLVMGGLALGLLLMAEAGVSVLALGRSLAAHFAGYLAPAAQLGLAAQVLFAFFPLIKLRVGTSAP